jgi:hypothetical protein
MYCNNIIPQLVVHVVECLIPQDTSVVDEYINSAKRVNGSFDNGITILGRCFVAHSFPSQLFNLLDGGVRID